VTEFLKGQAPIRGLRRTFDLSGVPKEKKDPGKRGNEPDPAGRRKAPYSKILRGPAETTLRW